MNMDNKDNKEKRLHIMPEKAPIVNFHALKDSIENGYQKITFQVLKDVLKSGKINKVEFDELHGKYTEKLELEKERLEKVHGIDASLTGLSTMAEPALDKLIGELNFSGEHRASNINAIAVVYLDLNKFKEVNDSYGHETGDQALTAFVDRMKSVIKEGTDLIFRLHGDEFVVIFPIRNDRVVSDEVLERLFQRLYRKVNDNFILNIRNQNKTIKLSASMGYTVLRKGETATAKELLDRADSKMYEDKGRLR